VLSGKNDHERVVEQLGKYHQGLQEKEREKTEGLFLLFFSSQG
jgi:hypothetical protein